MNYWYLALIGAGLVLLIFFLNYQFKFVDIGVFNAGERNTKKLPKAKQKDVYGKKVERIGTSFNKYEAFYGDKPQKTKRKGTAKQKNLFKFSNPTKKVTDFFAPKSDSIGKAGDASSNRMFKESGVPTGSSVPQGGQDGLYYQFSKERSMNGEIILVLHQLYGTYDPEETPVNLSIDEVKKRWNVEDKTILDGRNNDDWLMETQ